MAINIGGRGMKLTMGKPEARRPNSCGHVLVLTEPLPENGPGGIPTTYFET
jgi:hypothetical protein